MTLSLARSTESKLRGPREIVVSSQLLYEIAEPLVMQTRDMGHALQFMLASVAEVEP